MQRRAGSPRGQRIPSPAPVNRSAAFTRRSASGLTSSSSFSTGGVPCQRTSSVSQMAGREGFHPSIGCTGSVSPETLSGALTVIDKLESALNVRDAAHRQSLSVYSLALWISVVDVGGSRSLSPCVVLLVLRQTQTQTQTLTRSRFRGPVGAVVRETVGLAGREGFEPSRELYTPYPLSRRVLSTTQPPPRASRGRIDSIRRVQFGARASPYLVADGGTRRPRSTADVGSWSQDGVRIGGGSQEQALVHAGRRKPQRGLLPRPCSSRAS